MSPAIQVAESSPQPRKHKDRRRHQRVALTLKGRFLHQDLDHPIRVKNISCGGALFQSKATPPIDSNVVCYVDGLGRVPARITRFLPGGFAVQFETTSHKRDKLADQLTWLTNCQKYNLEFEELRSTPRKPASGPALVERSDGRKVQCRVVDISLTGAAFMVKGSTPRLGEHVKVGKLSGEVVRASGNEFAMRFLHQHSTPSQAH